MVSLNLNLPCIPSLELSTVPLIRKARLLHRSPELIMVSPVSNLTKSSRISWSRLLKSVWLMP